MALQKSTVPHLRCLKFYRGDIVGQFGGFADLHPHIFGAMPTMGGKKIEVAARRHLAADWGSGGFRFVENEGHQNLGFECQHSIELTDFWR